MKSISTVLRLVKISYQVINSQDQLDVCVDGFEFIDGFYIVLIAGPTDPTMTTLNRQSSIIVCRTDDHCLLEIQMRDMFKNAQSQPPNEDDVKLYQCVVDDVSKSAAI